MKNILHIARFDLKFMMRDRETILWMFVMPAIFMFFIGKMMGSGGAGESPSVAVLNHDTGFVSTALIAHLEDLEYNVVAVEADSVLQRYRRQIEIPADFTASVLKGDPKKVSFRRRGEESASRNFDELLIRRAVFRTLGDLITVAAAGDSVTAASLAAVRERPTAIELDSRTLGNPTQVPTGFQQSVPGIMVMFILLVLLTTGGVLLVVEREEGLLRRLAFSPVSQGEVVIAKIASRFVLGLIQAIVAVLIGTFLLRIDWGSNVPAVLTLICAYGLALSTVSVVVGNLARSRGQAVALGVLASNILGALGGCWWPIEIVSPTLQKLAWFLPTGWAMYGLHRVMSFGDGFSAILVPLGLLLALAVVGYYLARRTFRYQ